MTDPNGERGIHGEGEGPAEITAIARAAVALMDDSDQFPFTVAPEALAAVAGFLHAQAPAHSVSRGAAE